MDVHHYDSDMLYYSLVCDEKELDRLMKKYLADWILTWNKRENVQAALSMIERMCIGSYKTTDDNGNDNCATMLLFKRFLFSFAVIISKNLQNVMIDGGFDSEFRKVDKNKLKAFIKIWKCSSAMDETSGDESLVNKTLLGYIEPSEFIEFLKNNLEILMI